MFLRHFIHNKVRMILLWMKKKTLTIPKWLDREATRAHLNFSGILQEALKERLGIL